ncbi:MAG: hypothetical protein GXP35_10690, partial [Actinobacteria bacterium]|nr:hypothetical protein [Actinomycetota bacterium]
MSKNYLKLLAALLAFTLIAVACGDSDGDGDGGGSSASADSNFSEERCQANQDVGTI